jgi:hypothetical protein
MQSHNDRLECLKHNLAKMSLAEVLLYVRMLPGTDFDGFEAVKREIDIRINKEAV